MRNDLREILKHFTRPIDPDAVLLQRFAQSRDADAFAELVQRYGGLVWSQCRQRLGHNSDAEDAFQATFLVLVQSANKLTIRDQLGPWLHGVAHRVCLNLKRTRARQLKRDAQAARPESVQNQPDWDSTLAAVHEEVNRLPETLRIPFVMCYLEGQSTTDAAEKLGLKLGTFSARLSRAKDQVLGQLTRRGCLTAVVLSSLAAGLTAAPPELVNTLLTGVVTPALVPVQVLALTQGAIAMTMSKIKLLAASVLVGATLVTGTVGYWSVNAQTPPPSSGKAPATSRPTPPAGVGAASGQNLPTPGGPPGAAPSPAVGPGIGGPGIGPGAAAGGGFGPGGMAGGPGMAPSGGGGGRLMPQAAGWEYKIVSLNPLSTDAAVLNKHGSDGWELISVVHVPNSTLSQAYFKRRVINATTGGFPGGMSGMGGAGGMSSGFGAIPPGMGGFPTAGSEGGAPSSGGYGIRGLPSQSAPSSPSPTPFPSSPVGSGPVVPRSKPAGNEDFTVANVTVDEVTTDKILTAEGQIFLVDADTVFRNPNQKENDPDFDIGQIKSGMKLKIYYSDRKSPVMVVTLDVAPARVLPKK